MSETNQGGKKNPPQNTEKKPTPPGRDKKATTAQPLVKNPPTAKRPVPPPAAVKGSSRLIGQTQRSRYQRDQQGVRLLTFATIGIIALIALVLIVGLFTSVVAPNLQTLASVNGQNVSFGEYQKFRKLSIFKELGRLTSLAQSLGGDTAQQIQARIQSLQAELNNVASAPVDQATLENLVKNKLAEQEARKQFNITVSDDEINNYIKSQDPTFVLYTPTPNQTVAVSTATAGVVETAYAAAATSTANNTTPLPTPTTAPTPTVPAATATAGVTATAQAANATATAFATLGITPTPTVSGTPQATVTTTPLPTNTPLPADRAQGTVEARSKTFLDQVRQVTGLSEGDYKELEVRPTIIKNKVSNLLLAQVPGVGAPYPQLEASRIVTATETGALELLVQLKGIPQDQLKTRFGEIARQQTSNNVEQPRNGYMGWFIDGSYSVGGADDEVWKAANKLQIGQLTDPPVRTGDGWEIIFLTGRDDKRPLDAEEVRVLRSTDQNGDYLAFVKWLKTASDAGKPQYFTSPTPAITPTQLAPPVFTPAIPPTVTPNVTATANAQATAAAQATPAVTGTPLGPVIGGTTTPGATTSATGTTTAGAGTATVSGTTAVTTASPSGTTAATTSSPAATTAVASTPTVATTPTVAATTVSSTPTATRTP
jgi:parvulin-like peptidyl-prolyl isomerase